MFRKRNMPLRNAADLTYRLVWLLRWFFPGSRCAQIRSFVDRLFRELKTTGSGVDQSSDRGLDRVWKMFPGGCDAGQIGLELGAGMAFRKARHQCGHLARLKSS